jgi:hypothetical protein
LAVAHALNATQASKWEPENWKKLLGNEDVYRRVMAGEKVDKILKSIEGELAVYWQLKGDIELYP